MRSKIALQILLPGVLAGILASGATGQSCLDSARVGYLGINGLECSNCEFGGGYARFSTEPRITTIASGSPAAGVLRPGDRLVSVNGSLITSPEGGRKYVTLRPHQDVTLIVRRNGQLVTPTFRNIPGRCPATPRATPLVPAPAQMPSTTGVPMSPVRTANFGFGLACTDCALFRPNPRDWSTPARWEFRSPPEVYSVEAGGPAWRAGMRRGDRVTHIDGIAITDDDAGRRFGAVKPGQPVRFTYRRGNQVRNATIRAEQSAPTALAWSSSAQTEESLRRARTILEQLALKERQERELLENLREIQDRELQSSIRDYYREQAEQSTKLAELQKQILITEARLQEETLARQSARLARITPATTMRYSGRIGNTDIEVRGNSPVIVNETPRETIITIGGTVIRLKRRD